MKLVNLPLNAEDSSLVTLFSSAAWDECEELQVTDKSTFILRNKLAIAYEREEILVCTDEGKVVGGSILTVDDNDPHVLLCSCVAWSYVLPEYRNKGVARLLMREAMRYSRDNNSTVLKYSHRIKPWAYRINYIKVKHGVPIRR